VGGFSSFGCHLDLTTSNVVVSNKKNKPGCGPVFFASAGRFFPKKRAKKMQISGFQNGVSKAKKMPAQEASKKITCDL
jgi:tRNA A-37 threonylcarbamoyl transferase component Bud32